MFRRWSALGICVAMTAACGSSDTNSASNGGSAGTGDETAGAGARPSGTAGTSSAGGGGSGGSSSGGSSSGGSAGTAPSLADACAAICAAQSALSCAVGSACQTACEAQATALNPKNQSCQTSYLALTACEAGLAPSNWVCSDSDDNAIPNAGSCDSAVCAWACCASSLVADGDVWSRCSSTCPPDTGGGGTSSGGSGGDSGGSDGGGSAGMSGSGNAGGAGGTAGAGGGGTAGAPKTSTATRMICTGTDPIVCHFGGSPGDYAVTVDLGGAAAAYTEVQAEMHRAMLKPLSTPAGMNQEFSFVVNVRSPEGQPVEDGPSEGTAGLDLYFYGSHNGPGETPAAGATVRPLLDAVGYATPANTKRVGVFIAGDSTVCDQTDTDYAGWAQMLPASFNFPVSVANYADSGETSASFLGNGKLWGALLAQVKAGDWVLIQFGHNDKSDASGVFKNAITSMVTQAKNKGANPVLISPPARATYSGQTLDAQFSYSWGSVQPVMKQVATDQHVPYIDLTALTITWYNQLGPNGWQPYHALGTDRTHTNRAGADKIATFVTTAIKTQNIGLAQYLR